MKPIVTQYGPKGIFSLDETALYNAQPNRTLALKGHQCQGGRWYKDRATALLCCNAEDGKKFRPVIVGRFEKPRCLIGLRHYTCEYKASRNA
jgi:hypothetical protein